MDKIEEEKLLDILEIEKKFINNINFSDEPIVYPIDMTNGFVIDNVPEPILKKLALQISNITTGTTRTLTAPDANGTIATREWVGAKTIQAISAGTPSNSTGSDGDIIYQY